MRYLGSKTSTATAVEEIAAKLVSTSLSPRSFCDPFGGIGAMAAQFKTKGWKVTVGDHLKFPHYFQTARIGASAIPRFRNYKKKRSATAYRSILDSLRSIKPIPGWITNEYALERKFFSPYNAEKIDAVRMRLDQWRDDQSITLREYMFLIASLIDSADRVANTAGTYYAYLKTFTRRARHDFDFKFIVPVKGIRGECYLSNADQTVASGTYDVVYLDPPYSARPYDAYYHLPQSMVLGNADGCRGMAGMPQRQLIRSDFESARSAELAFLRLIDKVTAKLLLVQYSNEGLLQMDYIRNELSKRGRLEEYKIESIGYTTTKKPRKQEHALFALSYV